MQVHVQDMEEDVNCVLFALKDAPQPDAPAASKVRLERLVKADAPLMEELQDMLASMRVVDAAR